MKDRIDRLEKTIDTLQKENGYLKNLLNKHRIEFNAELISKQKTISTEGDLSPQDKIQLYRSFFSGRDDVYAVRWENSKTQKSGYAPACENEWQRMLCKKPSIKCSNCPNQKWKKLTDETIYKHLTGEIFIGIYPLLQDDRCCFLAIDFDKEKWQEDVIAFVDTCKQYGIPHLAEISQSGNGAHIWIFFEESIPAMMARNLGTALLTLTMQLYPRLSMDSYDRLFPNQDTLPKGGFGNLIALPLQGKKRANGNSTFINVLADFAPYDDIWNVLSKTKKLSFLDIQSQLEKIQRDTDILDIHISKQQDEETEPWENPTVTTNSYPPIDATLPKKLEIVKANLLYVPLADLPAKLINLLRKLAAFQNPEFYRHQAMRLSTFGKPRIIHCAELFDKYLGLPRGCEDELTAILRHYAIQLSCLDKRESGQEISATFLGKLTSDQEIAVTALLKHDIGVLSARTGFGKTVIAAKLIEKRMTNTLILVHRQQLLEQWQERLMAFLGLNKSEIGSIKGGKSKLTKKIDIAMLQSLNKKGVVSTDINDYGQVIIDECHHLSAFSFEQVLKTIKAKYVLGLTATPFRKDGHHPIIFMQCGPIRFQNQSKSSLESGNYSPKFF